MPELPLLGGTPSTGMQLLAAEFLVTIGDGSVWLSIGIALLAGAGCWAIGSWVASAVGLLPKNAPAGETLGVGLASGIMVLAAWWATIWSGGRSSLTPVAVGFAIALVLAIARGERRFDRPGEPTEHRTVLDDEAVATSQLRQRRYRSRIVTASAAGGFIIAIALLYGSTMAPSPRDGVQPVEFSDEAFYAVLGRDLATTGTETNVSPSGFSDLVGSSAQVWYHWAELWLASAAITVFGMAPLAARYFVVLPIVLLAAAALTGTLVRRVAGTTSGRAYVFGFLACLLLAPVPIPGTFFSSWAAGMTFAVNLYGLTAVAVLLALYCLAVLSERQSRWSLAIFVGSVIAYVLPSHIVIAALALFGLGSAYAMEAARSFTATHRLPSISIIQLRVLAVSSALLIATVLWGTLTGHGLGGSVLFTTVQPFNLNWQVSLAFIYLGAGMLLAVPIGALHFRHEARATSSMCFGAAALVIGGAVLWGARLGDFNMYHVFFGGLVVVATPIAAVAAWKLFESLRKAQQRKLVLGAVVLCVVQLGLGAATATFRLQEFGPRLHHDPIAVSLLNSIRQLPAGAKLAYACRPFEEFAFTDPSLLSIDAHTGRRVIPMCFQADVFSTLTGSPPSPNLPAAGFALAPQSTLYPDATSTPTSAAVVAFLKAHGIDYVFADAKHPNSLAPDAIPIARAGNGVVFKVP